MAAGRVGAAAACVLLLAACGTSQADRRTLVGVANDGTAVGRDGCPTADAGRASPHTRPLPGDVEVAAVLRCLERPEAVPGEGEWSFTIREQATGQQIEPLVGALRLPSERRTNGPCTMELPLPVTVAVQTASGDAMTVATPKDVCGKTRREVVAAYQSLTWTPTSRTRGKQVRPEAALAAGCDAMKDVLAISAEQAPSGGPGRVLPEILAGGDVRVCLYRAVYPRGWTPSSNTEVDGASVGGGVPDTAEVGRLEALLDAAGPATDCSQRHTRLAVISARSKQYFEPVYIELDGCLRVLAQDGTLRQADSRLPALLASMTAEAARTG